MKTLTFDETYLLDILTRMLEIPSPSGYTDHIVHLVGEELEAMGIPFELTRRGAIRAELKGAILAPDRAVVAHLDTLGGMVSHIKPNGRIRIVPIGTWSSRFAEGARVTVFSRDRRFRGTVLPLKASGHVFHEEVDTQPVSWMNLEIRLDERCTSASDVTELGLHVGDYVGFDTNLEVTETGFINARHLDDKAGAAVLLTAARALQEAGGSLPVDCYLLFTIFEEVGSGASAILMGDVAEMVGVDNATNAPGQNSSDFGVTIALKDQSGPFDYHLSRKLLDLCQEYGIEHARDVYQHYRCDAASALEAGNDVRTALVSFALDASHGYERTHLDSLKALFRLLTCYMQSPPTFSRDKDAMGPLQGFPDQPMELP